MFNIHFRVTDAATNKPTPVRLRIADLQGRFYPPLGRMADFPTGRNEDVGGHLLVDKKQWCYIDGSCEVPLPAGVPLTIKATKGPEYTPVRETITLGPGQMSVRLTIKRWINLRDRGWYSGDTRCHFLSPHAALLEAAAEDLSVVNLLATECEIPGGDGLNHAGIPNLLAFSGQKPCLEVPGHMVVVNTFNAHPVLGSLALLNCHRPVFPLYFGGPDSTDDWSLADWCDQCHRKKGLAVWADAFRIENEVAPEALADLILTWIDAVECTLNSIHMHDWYQAWSAGIRFPLVGASGKDSNRSALGAIRTYARLPPETPFTLSTWMEAVRSARTFVTSGPLLEFTVNDQPPGAVLDRPPEAPPLRIRAAAKSGPAYEALEIVANGEIIGRATPSEFTDDARLEMEYAIDKPCWLAARCHSASFADGFAHSSPIWVSVNGRMPADPAALQSQTDRVASTIHWVNAVGRFNVPRHKESLLARLKLARKLLLARLAT